MTKASELKDQTTEQLIIFIEDLERDLFDLKSEQARSKKIEKSHLIKKKRRDKARALTVLCEKKKNK